MKSNFFIIDVSNLVVDKTIAPAAEPIVEPAAEPAPEVAAEPAPEAAAEAAPAPAAPTFEPLPMKEMVKIPEAAAVSTVKVWIFHLCSSLA